MMNKPKNRESNIVTQELKNEVLVYDLIINKAYCLNQTSALVWQYCDGTRTVDEISGLMSRKLKKSISKDLVLFALSELRKENLLENDSGLNNHFSGLSRREVIKKVGLTSMVTLPIISTIVAPKAAMAQSTSLGLFAACTSDSQCASTNCLLTTRDQKCCGIGVINEGLNPGEFVTCVSSFTGQDPCDRQAQIFCCDGRVGQLRASSNCNNFQSGCFCT